jgi:hypothetical protein
MKTANTLLIKEINLNLVRKQLLSLRAATKQQLAKLTGLSLMTVSSIISELIDNGEVAEGNSIPSNGGRPSAEYCYNGEFNHAVVFLGYQRNNHNFIRMRVINMFGDCVYSEEKYLDTVFCDSFDDMLDRAFALFAKISIIGFGLPGEEENGIVTINDYPRLVGNEFMKHCIDVYNVPVLFENDVNAAVLGYYRDNYKNQPLGEALAGLYFPRLYYPGMGLIIGGEIHYGKQNFVGEFGRLPIGIEWDHLDYSNKAVIYDSISRLLSIVICTIAPEKLVLYGDFFSDEDAAHIKASTESLLQGSFIVDLEVKSNFEADYEYGLTSLILDRQYDNLFGKFTGVSCIHMLI